MPLSKAAAIALAVILGAVLVVEAIVPAVVAMSQSMDLAPGDTLTVTCGTSLSGSVTTHQSDLRCAPAAATPTATTQPAATPTPTNTSGVPACPHDPTKWHGLVERNGDGSVRCTYGHTHMDNPHALDGVLGPLPVQEISYPWQTFNSKTGALENDAKHRVYDWMVIQNQPCIASPGVPYSINNARWEVHADGNMGASVRYHSYFFQGELCDPNDPAYKGFLTVGGWLDYGHLEAPDGNVIHEPDDPTGGDPNLRRLHGTQSAPRYDFTWYGDQTPPTRDPNANYVGVGGGVRKADWGPVDPNDPTRVLFYGGNQIGGAWMDPFHLWGTRFDPWLPGNSGGLINYRGFVDRYGKIVPNCSPVGLDCIPLVLVNVKPGEYQFRSDGHNLPVRSYDVRGPDGKSLIQFPN